MLDVPAYTRQLSDNTRLFGQSLGCRYEAGTKNTLAAAPHFGG
jgi:hypothetical protein